MIKAILDSLYHGNCSRICNFELGLDILAHDKLMTSRGLPSTSLLSSTSRSQGHSAQHGAVMLFCGWMKQYLILGGEEDLDLVTKKIESALRTVAKWHENTIVGDLTYGCILVSYTEYCSNIPRSKIDSTLYDFASEKIENLARKMDL